MVQVILIGKDWKTRALLRAQLIEEGLEVEAYESVSEALEGSAESSVGAGRDAPTPLARLLIADLSASSHTSADAAQLAHWSQRIPIWITASRIHEKELQDRGFEAVLFRPIDIGELVERIKRRVKA